MRSFLLLFIILPCLLPAQQIPDTSFVSQRVESVIDSLKIKDQNRLSLNSDTISYKKYYLWNDRRNLGEVLNERAGYFINFLNNGGRNMINYNGFPEQKIGIFRDGVQINDPFFGGFDIENISVNGIEAIEEVSDVSSFLYGYNSNGKAINIITKDLTSPLPFSQLRYSQDRYNSLSADAFFYLPVSNKLNFQIGANKHSIDGRYANTDFDTWRARWRMNYYPSSRLNFKFNFYYTKIQRGLFEGLIYTNNEDSLKIPGARVVNPDSYEKLTNFFYDANLAAQLFREKRSLTKIRIYSLNSLREYRDEENRSNPNGIFVSENYHSIQYGIDVKQNYFTQLNRNTSLDILAGGNAYFNFIDTEVDYDRIYSGILRTDLKYNLVRLSAFIKQEQVLGDFNNNHFSFGSEGSYNFNINTLKFELIAGASKNYINHNLHPYTFAFHPGIENIVYNIGFTMSNKLISIRSSYYNIDQKLTFMNNDLSSNNYGINTSFQFSLKFLGGYINHNYSELTPNPKHFIKADFFYHNFFFENKLNLRTGFNLKYYNGVKYFSYSEHFQQFLSPVTAPTIKEAFNLDFYIGARVGNANLNFTLANLFDNFYYSTFLYPQDDRGGFGNILSRFTIVWDFIN